MDPGSSVLAILPLAVSAAENYRNVYKIFLRYRKSSKYVEQLGKEVKSQCLRYDVHRQALLATCLDENMQLVEAMLQDGNHVYWNNKALAQSMAETLGYTLERHQLTISLIVQELHKLSRRLEKMREPRIGRKLSFAIAKDEYDESIKRLRNLLNDLAAIRKEMQSSALHKNSLGRLTHIPTAAQQDVQQRSLDDPNIPQNLYDALLKACNHHLEHKAHLHLEISCSREEGFVSFKLGILRSAPHVNSHYSTRWLAIKSRLPEHLAANLRMATDLLADLKFDTARSPVGHTWLVNASATESASTSLAPNFTQPSENLCESGSLCLRLERNVALGPSKEILIGHIVDPCSCRHEIYTVPQVRDPTVQEAALPLALVLSGARQGSHARSLHPLEKIRLARQISSAMLELSNTSWVGASIDTDQIYLYGLAEEPCGKEFRAPEPYLDVAVRAPLCENVLTVLPVPETRLIRNTLLFRLGVILLELAFEKSLKKLRRPEDLFQGLHEHPITDFDTAARCWERLPSTRMGHLYSEVVQSCLWCDFGYGRCDLSLPEFRRRVRGAVVNKLEESELAQMQHFGFTC